MGFFISGKIFVKWLAHLCNPYSKYVIGAVLIAMVLMFAGLSFKKESKFAMMIGTIGLAIFGLSIAVIAIYSIAQILGFVLFGFLGSPEYMWP